MRVFSWNNNGPSKQQAFTIEANADNFESLSSNDYTISNLEAGEAYQVQTRVFAFSEDGGLVFQRNLDEEYWPVSDISILTSISRETLSNIVTATFQNSTIIITKNNNVIMNDDSNIEFTGYVENNFVYREVADIITVRDFNASTDPFICNIEFNTIDINQKSVAYYSMSIDNKYIFSHKLIP